MGGSHQARRIGGNEQSQESEQESTQYSHDRRRYLAARPSGHKRRCDLRLALQRSPVLRAGRRGSLHYQSHHGVSLETIIPITAWPARAERIASSRWAARAATRAERLALSSLKGRGLVKGVLSWFDLDVDSAEPTPVSRWSARSAAVGSGAGVANDR